MTEKNKKPQIRFKGFTDDWEHRKLSELGKTQSGIGFSESEQGGTDGVPFFKVSDMNNLGNEHEMKTANNYVNLEQLQRWKWKPIEDVPSIIFAKVGAAIMLNRKRLVRRPFLIDNNTMAYIFNDSWDEDFGKTLFETIPLPRYAQIGALPSYNGSDIEAIGICVPMKEEQIKIAELFVNLDNLITLHQHKYDKLQNIKKSMLEKLFPKNGGNTPEIRFKGFTDPWEQRELSDISNKVLEKNATLQFTETFTNSAEFGIINQRDFFDHDISNVENLHSYYVVKNNDFVYNPRISTFAPVGPINRNKLGRDGVMSPLYTVLRTHDIDNTFLEQYFKSRNWHSFMKLNGDSGARSDRFSIKDSIFIEMPIPYPNINEQLKIGEYLTDLDNLIILHQRELDKLKNMKKACLEKIFI